MLHTPRRAGTTVATAGAGVAALGLGLLYLVAPLNTNLRYEAGVKIVGDSVADDATTTGGLRLCPRRD